MAFKPEKVDSYEAGWKASVLDHRLQFATAVFDAEYKDVQVPGSAGGVTAGGVPTFVGITTNAGGARFRGVEFEANLRAGENLANARGPTEPLRLARLTRRQVHQVHQSGDA